MYFQVAHNLVGVAYSPVGIAYVVLLELLSLKNLVGVALLTQSCLLRLPCLQSLVEATYTILLELFT